MPRDRTLIGGERPPCPVTHLDESLTRIYHNKVGDGAAKRLLGWLLAGLARVRRAFRNLIRSA